MNTSLKTFKRISVLAQLTLIVFVAISSIKAQTSGVDLSFNTIPDRNISSAPGFTVQPDNKVVVFGNFQVANGAVKDKIARFNADGSLDASFNCTICNFTITTALSQPDGKLLVSGNVLASSSPFSTTAGVIYRLNSDGSRDTSFTSPFAPPEPNPVNNTYQSITVNNVQADGKILVILDYVISGRPYSTLYRLNSDGTFDNTFTTLGVGGGVSVHTSPAKIVSLPDGKILIAYNTSSGAGNSADILRFNSDGSTDSTFERPSFPSLQSSISDFDVLSDGSFIIVGNFNSINGFSRTNIAKLQSAGNVDTSFPNLSITGINRVKIQSDGKILIATSNRIYRLNADGSADNSFNAPTNITQFNFTLDSLGRIVLYGTFVENGVNVSRFARLNQDGSLDNTFNLRLGAAATVTAVAVQPDGKIIHAGDFLRVGGVPRVSIVRVNADGSLDASFNAGVGFSTGGFAKKMLIQPDGKILVGGTFPSYNGAVRGSFIRLNADGSLDESFNPSITSGAVNTFVLQSDGKIIIGGNFSSAGGQARAGIARLNADGSLDSSFNPAFGGSPTISGIVAQPDGKITVGGAFSGVNGFNRINLVRLNSDGSLDNTFNAGNISPINQLEILPDGRYLVLTSTIVRLNNNGTTDTTFSSPTFNGTVLQFFAQADGSILVGGIFVSVNNTPRANFIRLKPNGAFDNLFLPSGANGAVRTIARQTDGRILVGGDFSLIGGIARLSVARLNVTYRQITPYDYDGDGRADLTVFRPSNGYWYELNIQTNGFYAVQFGQTSDKPAPADYDGDGKTDIAVFRDVVTGAGNFAYFYILNSSDNSFRFGQFGVTGDVPMAGDWDGDGRADLAVYRNGTAGGQSYFYYRPSSQPNVDYYTLPLGIEGDKPLLGDFDGDGRLDPAVFYSRSSQNAFWLILQSSVNQVLSVSFGLSSDIPVPADYDGDGKTNIAVFRPSTGTWFTSTNAANNYGSVQFGASEDLPVPADYDGDGRADVAVFRPSTGAWYLNRSTQGFTGVQFGQSGDKPSPNAFIR